MSKRKSKSPLQQSYSTRCKDYEHEKKKSDTGMSKEDALIIKGFRKNHTLRGVARVAAEYWPDRHYCNGNQIEGVELCCKAAETLGEKPTDEPWCMNIQISF
jgi:hypothetical protein